MKGYLTVPLEVKSLDDRELTGHGSIFGNVDLGGEIVLPGAFTKSLDDHKANGMLPQMFWMHDPSRVPGKWIEMHEDDDGLYVRGVLAQTELGNEMRTLAQMKAVRGLSIGYEEVKTGHDRESGAKTLKEIDLWEVSLVSLAMNPRAQIESAKSRLSREGEYVPSSRELDRLLRDAGISRKLAKQITAFLTDPSGTLDDHLRDAGEDEANPEVAAALETSRRFSNMLYGAALRR